MSSDISFNSEMHNQAEVPEPDVNTPSSYQASASDMESQTNPQIHPEASPLSSSTEQLSSSIDSLGIAEPGGQQRESSASNSPFRFKDLPPEMKEEVAKHLPRKALRNLSQVNRSVRNQFRPAVQDSQDKSDDIKKAAKEMHSMRSNSDEYSSTFNAQMEKLSSQRPTEQSRDLNNFINNGPSFQSPEQTVQLWSQLLKHPIDQESMRSMARLARFSKLPVDKSSGIVNGLLDQIERQSGEGAMPMMAANTPYHPLEIAARMVRHMPPDDQQEAADRIRAMAQSENRPLTTIDYFLNQEVL